MELRTLRRGEKILQVAVTEKTADLGNNAGALSAGKGIRLAYQTRLGRMYQGLAEQMRDPSFMNRHRGSVRLILTSPPFPLNRKKRYGNFRGQEYVDWLASFAPLFRELLEPRGSVVMEVGNAWEEGRPVMSPLALQALLEFLRTGEFKLCQQFVCHNYATLPGPAEWVNVRRIRVKNAFTNVWWMSPSAYPWAFNKRVLTPYSPAMQRLLDTKVYNSGKRRSEHVIGKHSILRDNSGAIPSNVIEFANTASRDSYLEYCRRFKLKGHPARMATSVANFFIKFLTTPGKLVLDPFAGSNVTGGAAEQLQRRWISIEPRMDYIASSKGRFSPIPHEAIVA